MAARTDPRKVALAVVLVVALALVVLYRLKPALVEQVVSGSSGGAVRVGAYDVPSLGWKPSATAPAGDVASGRSLFTYGPPPTPTPDTRPTPTPPPTLPPRIAIPTPSTLEQPEEASRGPVPPSFPLTFMGWLGPDRLPIAVFNDSGEVLVVARGDTIKNRFVLREVGPSSVTIGYVGFPENVTRKVPLSQ